MNKWLLTEISIILPSPSCVIALKTWARLAAAIGFGLNDANNWSGGFPKSLINICEKCYDTICNQEYIAIIP